MRGCFAAEPAAAARPTHQGSNDRGGNLCRLPHQRWIAGSAANPILQGQNADYLAKQLADFKTGKRNNAIMKGMAAPLSDADMKNVAAFYASKQAKPGFAKNKDLASLGEKLYRGGANDRMVPACSGCHSPNGAGIPVQYPRLAGQHADYLEAQLVAFRGGTRGNSPVMAGIAAKLNDRELKAAVGLHRRLALIGRGRRLADRPGLRP